MTESSEGYCTCPTIVQTNSKSVGGVELLDWLIALYRTKVKAMKWYHRIVLHMIDFTLVNVWLLYRRDFGNPKKICVQLAEIQD